MARAAVKQKLEIETKKEVALDWILPGTAIANIHINNSDDQFKKSLFVVISAPGGAYIEASLGGDLTPSILPVEDLEASLRALPKKDRVLNCVLDNRSEKTANLKFDLRFTFLGTSPLIVQNYSFSMKPGEILATDIPVKFKEV